MLKSSRVELSGRRNGVHSCWGNVSQEYEGPGTSQTLPNLWNKITHRYHSMNPPIPNDRHGNPAPRQKSALLNKWKRMGPFISCFIKHVAFALANHRSGESADDDMKKAVRMYNAENKAPWSLMDEYDILKKYPKWMLDTIGATEQSNHRAGISQQIPMADRVARLATESPTVANTNKPQGVKRARMTLKELKETEKEMAIEEQRLETYIEQFSRQAEIQIESHKQQSMRTEQHKNSTDDLILMTNTSRMSPEVLHLFNRRLGIAMDNIDARRRLHEERKAAATAAAATAAAEADEVANGEAESESGSGDSFDSQATEYDSGTAHRT